MKTIGVIGAGAWGTALAQTQARNGHKVVMWAREPEVVESINGKHENTMFLPGIKLETGIRAVRDMHEAAETDVILLVTPAQHVRHAFGVLKHITVKGPVVICAKGIELDTGKLLTDAAAETAPDLVSAILTGPTFASEVARGLPCAVTLAASDAKAAAFIRDTLASHTLRPYVSEDIIGAQIGSAVKNVIAIACGVLHGQRLGESARAALMTRGLAEMARLTAAMGGKRETLMGLCGMGDLMLTASSLQSRNFSFGVQLGEGRSAADILAERKAVTEGVTTARAAIVMAKARNVDMPITEAVRRCVDDNVSVDRIIHDLMERPLRAELA
jgi:glycerol-3-phosphate dehydrogenase (NAD(P)+)